MRNYVIINGVNSNTIQGLAINILPPITKPMMRSQIEEIDGRDGDLVTELGYSAYDKTMEIGLWGTYDIDSIIKYFTGDGTIVFSTEPDKYYYFKILNQIDYEKLLKFKKATVTFHCQPYKYPTSETPLEEAYEYVEATGTDLTLNNTEETIFNKFDLIGNTYQDSTTGKNLYDDIYSDYTRPLDYVICPITLEQGQTYTLSSTLIGTKVTGTVAGIVPDGVKYADFSSKLNLTIDSGGNTYRKVFTVDETYTSPKVVLYVGSNPSTLESTFDNIFNNYHIQLEKGNIASPTYEPYTGGIPAPNPNFPEDVHVVSGNNEIAICGKNFFDVSKVNNLALSGTVVSNPTYRGYSLKVNPGDTYTISRKETTVPNRFRVCFTEIEPANNVDFYGENGVMQSYVELGSDTSGTVTVPSGMNYMFLYLSNNNETITTEMKIQIERGNQLSSYEEYTGATYPISLGNIEMCSIPNTDYKDAFIHEDNKWYKYAMVGKVVLNGSENWADFSYTSGNKNFRCQNQEALPNILTPPSNPAVLLSNYFVAVNRDNAYAKTVVGIAQYGSTLGTIFISAPASILSETTMNGWKNWLSTNNTTVYYVLANPTQTEITDETLKGQLDDIWENAISYKGQTNITQTNNDLPFIMDVSALELGSDHLIINNTGTAYSKPTIDIEGTGIVDIYLNDEQIFEIDLTTQNEIIIDTEKMEAYTPDNLLANRLVTGDYSNFKLAPGENDLRFSGDLTKATVTRYIRWI